MKKYLFVSLMGLSFGANAAPIDRINFNPSAINYGFDGVASGTVNITDGILGISNGIVQPQTAGDVISPSYYDGDDDSSIIRFDFSNMVSAVGLDFYSNNANTTLSLFDTSNNLLESNTITTANQFSCAGFLCGFVGIDYGSNSIAYATIDTPLNGNELYVDNITYQSVSSVPAPAAVWLFGSGLVGLIGMRKKSVKLSSNYA